MKPSYLITFITGFAISLCAYSQKFPFNISPLSSPYHVNAIQPIEKVSSGNLITGNRSEDTYQLLNSVSLGGVTFDRVQLKFQNEKLVAMTFFIVNSGDLQKINSSLKAKYKRAPKANAKDQRILYRNGNIVIWASDGEYMDAVKCCAGYLYYEYEQESDF